MEIIARESSEFQFTSIHTWVCLESTPRVDKSWNVKLCWPWIAKRMSGELE